MRTKTLLAAAALIAVGAASSMAQSNVYSLNIVGYVNVPVAGSLTAMANTLNAGPAGEVNRVDHVVPYADGNNVQIWTGVSWKLYTMDSLSSSGWTDDTGDVAPANLPVLGSGTGFFYGNNDPAVTNVTFVGEVRTGTNVVAIPAGLSALGSPLPYDGAISTGPIALNVQDGDNVQTWNGTGWSLVAADGLSSTGWTGDSGDVPEPTLTVGQGFFYGHNSPSSFNWTQILNQ